MAAKIRAPSLYCIKARVLPTLDDICFIYTLITPSSSHQGSRTYLVQTHFLLQLAYTSITPPQRAVALGAEIPFLWDALMSLSAEKRDRAYCETISCFAPRKISKAGNNTCRQEDGAQCIYHLPSNSAPQRSQKRWLTSVHMRQ